MFYRLPVALLLFALSSSLPADTLTLANGDRLTGTVVLLDGGKLVFDSALAGRVRADWSGVAALSSDKPLLVRRQGLDSVYYKRLVAAEDGKVLLGDSGVVAPLASITQLVRPNPLVGDLKWQGTLDAKFDTNTSSDSKEWQLKGETRVEHNRWRHVVNAEVRHKEANDKLTDDNWKMGYKLDYFYSPHWFVRGSMLQDEDRLNDRQFERDIGLGPGYSFWNDELGRLEFTGQLTRVKLASRDFRLEFNTVGLGWDYARKLWGTRLEATSKGQLQIPQIELIDYLFNSEFGLRYRLNDWANLSLLYEFEQISASNKVFSDQHSLLGIGVNW
ncbi:DUF481 domain-containing protein [Pseudomonas turukhanskensis]|uniref:Peptide chain release factor RF-3 n=1 Tax=Pseudomonas turukhanskensis TaxID=1806536 RepID=A0A9W6NET3_9PSED|nr:DUF481 domain-containing protein [Pseudomonas turukhanskensis]GLK88045.1 hypothetical protein GCM10017655_11070 [Pseudomonas turukhanskensis]